MLDKIGGMGKSTYTDKIIIPIDFISEAPVQQLAVNEEGLCKLLGLDDGRTKSAMKNACYRFRLLNEIPTLPGGVFPLAHIRKALSPTPNIDWRKIRRLAK